MARNHFAVYPATRRSDLLRSRLATLLPGISGQSFETLEALNLGPSDSVPKLTRCERTHRKPDYRSASRMFNAMRSSVPKVREI